MKGVYVIAYLFMVVLGCPLISGLLATLNYIGISNISLFIIKIPIFFLLINFAAFVVLFVVFFFIDYKNIK